MGFLKNIIRNAVEDGISKGIRDAVSNAAEKIIAPKAEAYANSVADSLDEATQAMNGAAAETEKSAATENALDRLSKVAEQYAAKMEAAVSQQEDFLKEWEEKLPGYPVWVFGGTECWISDGGAMEDGSHCYWLNAENATEEGLYTYVALLKEQGFVQKYKGSDEVLYKELDGDYLLFGLTDAFGTAPVMSVSFHRTKDRSEIEV